MKKKKSKPPDPVDGYVSGSGQTIPKNRCTITRVRPVYCVTEDNTVCIFEYVNKVVFEVGIPGGWEADPSYYLTNEDLMFRRVSGFFDNVDCYDDEKRIFDDV